MTATEAIAAFKNRTLSPVELLKAIIARCEQLQPKVNALTYTYFDRALEQAKAAEAQYTRRGGEPRPLEGVTVAIKDFHPVKDEISTYGSKIYRDYRPDHTAPTVQRLLDAGAIMHCRTTTPEFAHTGVTASPLWGITRNPWNLEHTPGGSSSGSGAAVAARMCHAAIGSQTGGSTIRPASYCGIVGMKPSFGRISRYGMLPLAPSLDHVGIFARSATDAAAMLEAMAGEDPRDPASRVVVAGDYIHAAAAPERPPRIALMPKAFDDCATEETRSAVARAVARLADAGARIESVEEPASLDYVTANILLQLCAEAAEVHRERFAQKKDQYGPKIREFVERGLDTPAWEYIRALEMQRRFRRETDRVLARFDVILTPATPAPAPAGIESTGDPSFNLPWSLSGHPVVSLPCALAPSGLPVSIQLTGAAFEEGRLLSIARWCEEIFKFDALPPAAPL